MTQLPIFLTICLFMSFYLPHSSSSEDTRCPRSQSCTERTSCPWYKQKWEELKALDGRSDAYNKLKESLKAKVCNKRERKVCCCTGAFCSILGDSEQDSSRGSVLNPGNPLVSYNSRCDPDVVEGKTRCCPKKVVAGNSTVAGEYILDGELPVKVHVDCKDNCIYSKDGEDFCFGKIQPTDYTVQCSTYAEETKEDGPFVIRPWHYICERWFDCRSPQIGCKKCKLGDWPYWCRFWRNRCCKYLQPNCRFPKHNILPPVYFDCPSRCP